MQVKQIDAIRVEACQAFFALSLQGCWRRVPGLPAVFIMNAALGRDHDFMTMGSENARDHSFAFAFEAIAVGGVEEIDPGVECRLKCSQAVRFIDINAGDSRDRPAAHGHGSDKQVSLADPSSL